MSSTGRESEKDFREYRHVYGIAATGMLACHLRSRRYLRSSHGKQNDVHLTTKRQEEPHGSPRRRLHAMLHRQIVGAEPSCQGKIQKKIGERMGDCSIPGSRHTHTRPILLLGNFNPQCSATKLPSLPCSKSSFLFWSRLPAILSLLDAPKWAKSIQIKQSSSIGKQKKTLVKTSSTKTRLKRHINIVFHLRFAPYRPDLLSGVLCCRKEP